MNRFLPLPFWIALAACLSLGGCDDSKPADPIGTDGGGGSLDSWPTSLVGTWIRIDSNFIITAGGDSVFDGSDDGYVDHDTVYNMFAADGRFGKISINWSIAPNSYTSHHVDTGRGTWSVSGDRVTTSYLERDSLHSTVNGFAVNGAVLTLLSSKSGRKSIWERISASASIPAVGGPPGSTHGGTSTTSFGLVFSPASGAYTAEQNVTITGSVPGSSIYYTTNGSTPTTSSTLYTGPIKTNAPTSTGATYGTTIRAIEVVNGLAGTVGTSWYTVRLDGAVVLAPVVSPSLGGRFSGPVAITVAAAQGDTVSYGVDGSTMNRATGAMNQATLTIASSGPITAMARRGINSPIISGYFHIDGTIDQPVIQVSSTDSGGVVSITDSIPAAEIHYTIDGSTPSSASALYSAPVFVAGGKTVRAVAIQDTRSSSVAYRPVVSTVAAAVFTPAAGTYSGPQVVSISTSTVGATLYYTTDGSNPTLNSNPYTGPITMAASGTLKVLVAKSGSSNRTTSASYVISTPAP